jgi:flagellar protein FlaG
LVNEGNAVLRGVNSNLQFQIDDSTHQVVVKIIDNKTGDVIRQIPTVEMLDFIRHMKELEGNAGAIGAIFQAAA